MKRIDACVLYFILVFSFWNHNQSAEAHGTGYRVLKGTAAITVEFFYSDNEPMRYVKVLVFSPQDQNVEYQNGRTDRQGKFAFCPETAGIWRIEANDEIGHKEQGFVEVEHGTTDKSHPNDGWAVQTKQSGITSRLTKTVLGLSLIANLAFAVYALKRRATTRKDGAQKT